MHCSRLRAVCARQVRPRGAAQSGGKQLKICTLPALALRCALLLHAQRVNDLVSGELVEPLTDH